MTVTRNQIWKSIPFYFSAMMLGIAIGSGSCDAQEAIKKLPLEGESYVIEGSVAFLIPTKSDFRTPDGSLAKPWVWYAPTLPNLPGPEERWMFERFVQAGIAIAGIDAGESYGSPDGNRVFDRLHAQMVRRGYSARPVLLGRSRGGLQTLSWAAEHPEKVSAWAGIYPVCNLASYPGIERAAGAYKLTAGELEGRLKEFNPIDRMSGLAKSKVPLFAIHGDVDTVVPLELNSGKLKSAYAGIGGPEMELIVPAGQGHNMWEGFFKCKELVDFVLSNAR
jgi:hypothetical protein